MDIEKLNKSQIILLTLLVSFMTSIATGIVTVSLMQQAPPAITQTVNKVIEHTVERVVPGQAAAAASSVPGKTVVVKESDLIAQALEKVSPSVVRLYTSASEEPKFLGLGLVLAQGAIAIDASVLGDSIDAVVELSGSARVRAFVTARDEALGLAFLTAATSTQSGTAPSWTPATLAAAHAILGQTVITVSGRTATRLGTGLVTAVSPLSKAMPDGVIETDILATGVLPGGPIFDTSGNIMGMSTAASRAVGDQGFISSAFIRIPTKETGAGAQ